MSHKDVIHKAFVATIYFFEDDQVVAFVCDLLHSLQNDSAAITEVVGDDDLCKAAVTLGLKDFNHCMRADISGTASD